MRQRLKNIRKRIQNAVVSCGRDPESVCLVAVSKTVPENRVKEAVEAGVTHLGENYIQEARKKIENLSGCRVSWHFIGHLQSNKAKYAVKLFDLIHSVDSFKLARELDKQAGKINKIQKILIQVNMGKELSKSGVFEEDAYQLLKKISFLENISVKGFMTIPPFFDNPEKARPYFSALRNLRDSLDKRKPGHVSLKELSMGMTGDFEAAIEEGATCVRIGTAIFGKRK